VTIRGYGAVFYDENDPGTEFQLTRNQVERILPGAFDDVDTADIRSMFNHEPSQILGRTSAGTMRVGLDDVGFWYETDLDMGNPDHVKVASSIDRRDVDGSSIWFYMDSAGEGMTRRKDGERIINEIRSVSSVMEMGPVTVPAYTAATSAMRAKRTAEEPELYADLERLERANAILKDYTFE
jgi:HK97 family phage prohead protease